MSEEAWQWKLDEKDWTPVLPGVVATHSGAITWDQECWGAVVRVGPCSALSGDAGLIHHGMKMGDVRVIDVVRAGVAGKRWRTTQGTLVRPHQLARFATHVVDDGIPVVRAPLAVVHAAVWAPSPRAAEWRICTAVQQQVATAADIRSAVLSNLHLPRADAMLIVLDDVELGAHAMSELDFLRLCRRYDLPEPDELQVKVRVGGKTRYLDARWRKQRVRAEIDGQHHMWVANWEADLLRSNDLAISSRGTDEIELRFSGSQVRHDQAVVARQLRCVLL
jgi:hypothetical protein